jgi:hypothetical protein
MGGACRRIGNVYRILAGIPLRKRPPGIPRRRWKNNITKNLREIELWNGSLGSG